MNKANAEDRVKTALDMEKIRIHTILSHDAKKSPQESDQDSLPTDPPLIPAGIL